MVTSFVQKNKVSLLAALLGAIAGALYYYFVGCRSGNCMIVSNPFIIVPYGAVLGFLFAGMFTKKENQKPESHENS